MIIKSYELSKMNLDENRFILLYGKNEGHKIEIIDLLTKNIKKISRYDEKEILDNESHFLDDLLNKSLFDEQKVIVIQRGSEKIINIIENLNSRKIKDILIIINAENLEKKSKLRTLFEKNKSYTCIPFYPDNSQTLSKITYDFLNKKKISISPININLIINKCNGDRQVLFNELNKIQYFAKGGKKLTSEIIEKLTNLIENHSISELIDNCLAKNKKKIITILNENNYSNEDCILIVRTFLNKSKKLLALSETFEANKNIELTISSAKPPIFWKEKEITKHQIQKWSSKKIKQLIYALNDTELQIKKNINNSINLIIDFILLQSCSATSN